MGAEIRINQGTLGRTEADYWNELLGHEFGHIFGLANVTTPGCKDYTLMTEGEWIGYLPQIQCADLMAIGDQYAPSSGGGGDQYYEPAPGEDMENCWDVYWVHTTYYIWSDGHVTQGATSYTYLYTECGPDLE